LHDPLHHCAGADKPIARRFVSQLFHPLPLAALKLDFLEQFDAEWNING
jgi:hypothetical protein